MSGFKVVVTDQVFPGIEVERELLAAGGATIEVASGSREDVLALARDADALLNTYMPFDAEAISNLERCRVIARYGIGVDNIDLRAARDAGIAVTNVPDYCIGEVATHAVATLLALWRRIPTADAAVRRGEWGVDTVGPVRRLEGSTIGLVGVGRVGRRVAVAFEALGAKVIAHDPYADPAGGIELVELADLLARSDAISIHTPLTPETRGLFGRAEFARMRPHAILVNTSRGPIVTQADLLGALRAGVIGGAALDVFETEPPDAAALAGVPGLLVTPHVAFYSEDAIVESQRKASTQVLKALRGEPLDYLVN
jgi:D-3-phosphoglycerate dehydrogenase / 2-oxoglutarate reductase